MNELRLPFTLWLAGETAPDLSSMSAPIRISIWLHLDHQQSGQTGSSVDPKAKDDADV
jgi:hypothetical protein